MRQPIYHSGIKDMRWGVRRFQYHDGTYTPLGKERRRKGNDGYVKPTKPTERQQDSKPKQPENSRLLMYKNMSQLTDAELKTAFARAELENKYMKELMTKAGYTKSESKLSKAMKTFGTVATTAATATKYAGNIAKFAETAPDTFKKCEAAYVNLQKKYRQFQNAATIATAMKMSAAKGASK